MNNLMGNTQKRAFNELITTGIPQILKEHSGDIGDEYQIAFTPLEANNKLVIHDDAGTEYHSIKTKCVLKNRYSGEEIEFNAELLKLPILQVLGFKIKGNYMQCLDEYERARGWSFIDDGKVDYAKLFAENGRYFAFNFEKARGNYNVSFAIRGQQKEKVSPSTFLRVISGYSNEELCSLFGFSNKHLIEMFGRQGDNEDIHMCIRKVANAMFGDVETNPRTTEVLRREIMSNVMSSRYFPLGASNLDRLRHSQSFSYRANSKVLAENVRCNGYEYNAGLVLTERELAVIDKLPLKSLKVEFDNKIFQLHKFSNFSFDVLGCKLYEAIPELGLKKGTVLSEADVTRLNDSDLREIRVDNNVLVSRKLNAYQLTRDDLFTAFSIWADNLNGFGLHEKQFEVSNRILVTFDRKVKDHLNRHLSIITDNISNKLKMFDMDGRLSMAAEGCSEGIDTDAFISDITSTKVNSGQMSDMCNIVAYMSKGNKATAQVPTSAVTDEMRCVQDLQEGRFDPLDVPESDAIGKVHNRTMFTTLDEDGNAVAPYLRVVNGEVLSNEPVYLTAMQETDQFIAEWDETFLDADGNKKKRVRTRCNGNVQSVEIERVTYKQVSPYQDMSVAHGLVPFPGHSNGKRITMECNQVKQALVTVNTQFPVVCSGTESMMDIGTYTARGILADFYDSNKHLLECSKEEVLGAKLKLSEISSERGTRTLMFNILGIGDGTFTTTLTVPFLFKNYEGGMFSYNVNPKSDGIYSGDDVVAFYNGSTINRQEVISCADFGSMPTDESMFGKGLALVQNLHVGYKTYDGSVIEDGILISGKLVYDDTLTHIALVEVKEIISVGQDADEEFGIQGNNAPDYLQTNGLPVVGTYLKPGMAAIGKIRKKSDGGSGSAKYVSVPMHAEGQVISTKIREKNNGLEASVWLARRAFVNNGDKMAGRCGNKGVIAKIVPESEMPYSKKTGQVLDVVLNPLGIPSRQNITQLLEVLLGYCAQLDGKVALVTPYNKNDVDFVREQAEIHDVHPEIMVDGRTGEEYARPINHGVMPMYKLHHVSDRKIHAVGMDAKLHSVFLQPMKGSKVNGGQNIGEMEAWCLESVEATTLLQELFSAQSDDVEARQIMITAQNAGEVPSTGGNNHNDLTMQACYRSLGVEVVSDAEKSEYRFTPLTDDVITALCGIPVTNGSMLHSTVIFGNPGSAKSKTEGMNNWGWMELNTKLVMPLWVIKGQLHTLLGVSSTTIRDLVEGKVFAAYYPEPNSVSVLSESEMVAAYDRGGNPSSYATGIDQLVYLLENFDTVRYEETLKALAAEKKAKNKNYAKSDVYLGIIDRLKIVHDFNQSGVALSDYVTSTFPIMPQTYRPIMKVNGRNSVPSFDWYYKQILSAAATVKKNGTQAAKLTLYNTILAFTGVGSNSGNESKKYTNLLQFFSGKGRKSHGGLREHVQSKRVMCSGRAAIKPAEDITRSPLEVGIPFTMMIKMFEEPLYGFFLSSFCPAKMNKKHFIRVMAALARRDKADFLKLFYKYKFDNLMDIDFDAEEPYTIITEITKSFLEGRDGNPQRCVVIGRQPSLHVYSVRAFRPYVVNDKLIHMHPLVCKGFNADFDGDQSWAAATQSKEATSEAFAKISPAQDLLLPKSGAVVLEHTQDIVLGVYCATMLRDNALVWNGTAESAAYYDNIDTLWMDYQSGKLTPWDLVVYSGPEGRRYLSTAGRMIFNSFIPGGFTDKAFTNTLGIEGIKPELYNELKYDGIVCSSGDGMTGGVRYYNLPGICKSVYEEIGEEAIAVYQEISEFGFIVSDRTGVSLSIEDFEIQTEKDAILEDAERTRNMIEQDYQDGLISAEDKREALISLYGDSISGANTRIMKSLLDNLDRNNNIFIMMDSGARGNKTQLMHMCGAIGILQKSKVEDLETSVVANYYSGLNTFDVHLASYSARTGVASTQNETKTAGYTTRNAVYMASGIQVVENDCGKDDWGFDVEWGDHRPDYDTFLPSIEWFNENLVGKHTNDKLPFVGDDGVFRESDYPKLVIAGGFHEINLDSGTVTADVYSMIGHAVLDTTSQHLIAELSEDKVLTASALDGLLRAKISSVTLDVGTINLRYAMASSCRSLMNSRIARGLPGLKRVHDVKTNQDVDVITDDTIDYVERNKVDKIDMRTTLNCKSKYGICAHCFGLRFSNGQLPEIGSFVGVESAQSIAEPASQLTLNVINKGGVAGASSVSSGVAVFKSLLSGGSGDTIKEICKAVVAPNSGYLHIDKLDDSAVVDIAPMDACSKLCIRCRKEAKSLKCPFEDGGNGTPMCRIGNKIPYGDIIQQNGEWVNAGDAITKAMIHPDSITSLGEHSTAEEIHTRKQRVCINNYYNTFKDSGVSVNARHFELIAYVQNKYARVVDSRDDEYSAGSIVEFNEVSDKLDKVMITQMLTTREEVIVRSSGALAALSFEDVAGVAANLVTKSHVSSTKHNHSLLASVAIGENLDTREVKAINTPKFKNVLRRVEQNVGKSNDDLVVVKETAEEQAFDLNDIDLFSLDALTSFDQPAAEAEPKEPHVVQTIETMLNPINVFDSGEMDNESVSEPEPTETEVLDRLDSFGIDPQDFLDDEDEDVEDSGDGKRHDLEWDYEGNDDSDDLDDFMDEVPDVEDDSKQQSSEEHSYNNSELGKVNAFD